MIIFFRLSLFIIIVSSSLYGALQEKDFAQKHSPPEFDRASCLQQTSASGQKASLTSLADADINLKQLLAFNDGIDNLSLSDQISVVVENLETVPLQTCIVLLGRVQTKTINLNILIALCTACARKFEKQQTSIEGQTAELFERHQSTIIKYYRLFKAVQENQSKYLCENVSVSAGTSPFDTVAYSYTLDELKQSGVTLEKCRYDNHILTIDFSHIPLEVTSLDLSDFIKFLGLREEDFGYIKEMDIRNVPLEKLDLFNNLLGYSDLEKLVVYHCNELKNILYFDPLCPKLKHLVLNSCALPELVIPDNRLTNEENDSLESIQISWCDKFKKIDLASYSRLNMLSLHEVGVEEVILKDCLQLKEIILPKSYDVDPKRTIKKLVLSRVGFNAIDLCEYHNLEQLSISKCPELKAIQGIKHCSRLKKLILDLETTPATVPVSAYAHVQSLTLLGSKDGVAIAEHIPVGIKALTLQGVKNNRFDISPYTSLESLRLIDCPGIKQLVGLHNCTALKSLEISSSSLEVEELDLSAHTLLKTITVTKCKGIKKLRGLQHCTLLKSLNLSSSSVEIEELDVSHNSGIKYLNLSSCKGIKKLRGIEQCTLLRTLDISSSSIEIEELDVAKCLSLYSLRLKSCRDIKRVIFPQHWTILSTNSTSLSQQMVFNCYDTHIEELDISECTLLKKLDLSCIPFIDDTKLDIQELDLSGCTALGPIKLSEREGIKKIVGIDHCTKLKTIDFSDTQVELEELDLSFFPDLEELHLTNCTGVKSIKNIEQCNELITLSMSGVRLNSEKLDLSHCISLKELDLSSCIGIKKLFIGSSSGSKVKKVIIANSSLEQVYIHCCHALEKIDAHDCRNLRGSLLLDGYQNLTFLDVRNTQLVELGLYGCIKLSHIDARGCANMTRINGLRTCRVLRNRYLPVGTQLTNFPQHA